MDEVQFKVRVRITAATLLMAMSAGLAYAQRLDGPEIVADCQRGPKILKLCNSGCRADEDYGRRHGVTNEARAQRLGTCLQGCWGISQALAECPKQR
jgi:hypothetical protein